MRTPILQFGTSRFLQAHVDLFVSEAMEDGQAIKPITVIQSSGDAARAKRLSSLVGAYPVRIEGLIGGKREQRTTTVRSIARTLSTVNDWREVSRIFTDEAEYILSNTGDAGYAPQPADTMAQFDQAMSYPAKLLQLLRARFAMGAKPIQIMPMELIANNGLVLKTRVIELAQNYDNNDFIEYLESEIIWVNSLVDRIVSEPLEPAGAVAEPYALWAIENHPKLVMPFKHPCVQVVPSLQEIEALKLFVLNLSHTFLADRWIMAKGKDTVLVRDLMENQAERARLDHMLASEVRPAFLAAGLGAEFDPYLATTMDRLANPFLAHKIADISQNHIQKIERRISSFLKWATHNGDNEPKPILTELIHRNGGITT